MENVGAKKELQYAVEKAGQHAQSRASPKRHKKVGKGLKRDGAALRQLQGQRFANQSEHNGQRRSHTYMRDVSNAQAF